MKDFNLNASILKGTNEFISTTEEDWSVIRSDSSILFGHDHDYYMVSNVEKFFYIKDFQTIDSKTLMIDESGINILHFDSLKISYKEAELSSILNIKNGGSNYKEGDKIYLSGGLLSKDILSGKTTPTSFIVTKTNDGFIIEAKILNKGKYIKLPEEPYVFNSNSGQNVDFQLIFKVIENRAIIEREVEKVEHNSGKSLITLNYSLPEGIINGKISVDKWKGYLTENYKGDDKINSIYKVIRDFTPHLKIPKLSQGNPHHHITFNRAIHTLENEIKALQERILKLELKS